MTMKLMCKCGNQFDFSDGRDKNEEKKNIQGFAFETIDTANDGEALAIHCLKCDKVILLYAEEEEENGHSEM